MLQGELIDNVHSNQLVIALEPEAASLTCRTIQTNSFTDNRENQTAKPTFEPGTKYIVVDAGGLMCFKLCLKVAFLKHLSPV